MSKILTEKQVDTLSRVIARRGRPTPIGPALEFLAVQRDWAKIPRHLARKSRRDDLESSGLIERAPRTAGYSADDDKDLRYRITRAGMAVARGVPMADVVECWQCESVQDPNHGDRQCSDCGEIGCPACVEGETEDDWKCKACRNEN